MFLLFGYVTPLKDELKIREYNTFKSYYCGLCFHIKKDFGNFPRMVLNYDMTFLALVLDGLSSDETHQKMKKCFTNPVKKKPVVIDNASLSYAAAMNVALVYYKLLDDVADDKNVKSKTLACFLNHYKKKFSPQIQNITGVIQDNLSLLTSLERDKNFESIDEICHPFSLIVANIFQMYPYPIIDDSEKVRENLFQFGYALGKWIYMIDALDDLEKDMEKGKFNPLDFLYNKKNLPFQELLEQIKETVSFTILNCGYNCQLYFSKLPITKNKEIITNIIELGMMDQYNKVTHNCQCTKKQRK